MKNSNRQGVQKMKNPVILFGALGIGAGLMYFLDPIEANADALR